MLDPELAVILAAAAEAAGEVPPPPVGDALALRAQTDGLLAQFNDGEVDPPDVSRTDHEIAVDGGSIMVRWYAKAGQSPGSAVVYAHGGGMVCGTAELYDRAVAGYTHRTGVPFLSVDYRLAPERSGESLVRDTFAGLQWLLTNADTLGVDRNRVAIMGDSAGGGIAAGVAILARDQAVPLARQILIYPMLDDTNIDTDPELAQFASWSYDSNLTGWGALLGEARGTAAASPLAAPSRLADHTGLAPAFIDVGDMDIFRDEDIRYALALLGAGVPTELVVRPGCIHGFDRMGPETGVGRRSWDDRDRVIRSL
ncbi:MAG: alpha/beta hydrolase fold domain-containing protein [Beutenbergiaceae bacterium]